MIIGLTGTYCAGKDTVAEYLVEKKGFAHCSLSDELRLEMQRLGIGATRENLIRCGTELRRTEGNGVLAKRALKRCADSKDTVITSIRHPGEVEVLRGDPDFVLVNVDAPVEVRFARMQKRGRPGDPTTLEEFKRMEREESQTQGPGQQLQKCREMASYQIINDSDNVRDLHRRIKGLLEDLSERAILIIDDDPDGVAALESILRHRGHRVVAARYGETGLEWARNNMPDLIILDVMMPGMNGYQVCEAIKGDMRLRDIPVIMVTAKSSGEDVETAIGLKADWYITKPYDIRHLVEKINQLLKKKE